MAVGPLSIFKTKKIAANIFSAIKLLSNRIISEIPTLLCWLASWRCIFEFGFTLNANQMLIAWFPYQAEV